MNKTLLFIASLMLVTACAKPKVVSDSRSETPVQVFQAEQAKSDPDIVPPTSTNNKTQPEWVDNADREGKITAVGIANPNPIQDLYLQRSQAVNRGMAALAQKLETKVDSLYEELLAINSQGTGKKPSSSAISETRNTIRTLVSIKVKGVKVPSFWTDKNTGRLFVLCQLNDDASMQVLRQSVANQPELEKALDHLDSALISK